MDLVDALADDARYHRQIDRLASRARGRRLDHLLQEGVRFAQILEDRERVVTLLRRAMCDASFRPGLARLSRAAIGGKEREIARLGPLDLVAHGTIAEILAERLEARLSPQLYSYRRGRSTWNALRVLARFVRAHRRSRPDPRTRGLYVLRSDIKSYTDSIPLVDGAILWRELREALGAGEAHFAMVRALMQPLLDRGEGTPASRDRGLLFGAPTTNVAGNLYLMPLDTALDALDGGYARFGDDVLFAHADPAVVRRAKDTLETILAERGVEPNRKKLCVLHWNGAARRSLEWPEARGVSEVPFLGASLRFDGTIQLSPAKWSSMLQELRARIRRTARLLAEDKPAARARVLAEVVNASFDVRSELALREATLVTDLVSDRAQLRQLDYWVARWIAEAASRKAGPRAFRTIPYYWLRTKAALTSRVVSRNT